MSESTPIQSGTQTDAETSTIDETPDEGDNSIRAQIEAQLSESDAPADSAAEPTPEPSDDGAVAPTVDDAPSGPQSWTEDERQSWDDIPEAARDAISRREKEYHAGLKSDAELQKVLHPVSERLDGTGVHVDQYIDGLIKGDQFISKNPLSAVMQIIQRHNLADQVATHFGGDAPSNVTPSAGSGDTDRIAQLEQQIAVGRQQSDYDREVAAAGREWDAFKSSPEHSDAEDLREVIAAKIGANPALSYGQAYEAAKMLVGNLNGKTAKTTEAAAIAKSTRSSSKGAKLDLPRGRSDTSSPSASSGDLRDDIAKAMHGAGLR